MVPKSQRPKWRFMVKNFIKELEKIPPESENFISIALAEPEKGIEYYFKNYRENDKEITLCCALDLIECTGEDDLWIKVYEYGLQKKVKPREQLRRQYEERKGK